MRTNSATKTAAEEVIRLLERRGLKTHEALAVVAELLVSGIMAVIEPELRMQAFDELTVRMRDALAGMERRERQ